MSATDTHTDPVTSDAPLTNFTQCHAGIVRRLTALDELPALLEPAARARRIAEESLAFFREAIFEHHMDEERELFPAVIASAQPGAERERVQGMVDRLTSQHRTLEALWKSLERELKRVARGQDSDLDAGDLRRLVSGYMAHARYEETDFLPAAEMILGRNDNHMAALGLSLHLRHVPTPVPYV